jgi:peroxiredoxin
VLDEEPRAKRADPRIADWLAFAVVLVIGAPLVYSLASAFADGEVRRREAPLRALVGSDYDALLDGQGTAQNYLQRPPIPTWLQIFPQHQRRQDPRDDRRVPDFSLPTTGGPAFRMRTQRGKVVVLNFWTSTCQPCMEEMPSIVALSQLIEDRDDIELVTITIDRDTHAIRSMVPRRSPLTVLLDPQNRVVRRLFGTRLFPETWVIDPRGVIRLRIDGPRDWSSPLVLDVLESYR